MENVVWFKKNRYKAPKSNSDCTVSNRKKKGINTIAIKFRNGVIQTLGSDYIRIGLSKDGKRLYFAPAQNDTGWKLGHDGVPVKNLDAEYEPKKIQIADEKLCDGLLRFIGDYDMEISEDNLLYIDSRNRK